MSKFIGNVFAALGLAILAFAFFVRPALVMADTPPVPGAILATPVTTTVPGPTTTTQTDTVTAQQFTALVKKVEKITHRKQVFYMKPNGLGSTAGCVDPVKRHWIKPHARFKNAWEGKVIGGWNWVTGDLLCHIHHNADGSITGTIKRCGNSPVTIYPHPGSHRVRKILKATEYVSHEEFIKKYASLIQHTTSTSTSTTTQTTYICSAGYTLSGIWCLPPNIPVSPPRATVLQIQEVDVNETNAIQSQVMAPSGDALQVCFTADVGKFSQGCYSTTGAGMGSPVSVVNPTYTAPSDEGYDVIVVSVFDQTTGLNNDQQTSEDGDFMNTTVFPVQNGSNPT